LLYSQVGRNDHDHICESLELFAREVMPEFVERDERASKERAERVAPFVEKALARKRELPRREPASR
jgi:hypothetical protein